MAAEKTYEKKALLTGVGNMYLQMIETEDSPESAPTYATTVHETPSLDKVAVSMEINEKDIYLSNKLHTTITAVKYVNINVDAGYFPTGVAEEAQGMVNIGGGWSMPTRPKKKPFRLAFPITDTAGNEIIYNFPKCILSPVNINSESQREDINEQLRQYVIKAVAPEYKGDAVDELVYHEMDLAVPENKTKYDRDKLLAQGWYDTATATAAEKVVEG